MKTNLELPDNVTLNFDANGAFVRVVLNIPKELVKYVSPNNLSKGGTFNIYQIQQHIPSSNISKNAIMELYRILLARAMSNVRGYKAKYYEDASIKFHNKALELNDF